MDTEELMIEFLKQKQVITSLEKDILDTRAPEIPLRRKFCGTENYFKQYQLPKNRLESCGITQHCAETQGEDHGGGSAIHSLLSVSWTGGARKRSDKAWPISWS